MTQDFQVLHANYIEKILVFVRGNDACGKFLVVVNLTNRAWESYRFPLPHDGNWRLVFKADAPVYGNDFGSTETDSLVAETIGMDHSPFSAATGIGSYDCLVFADR